MLMYTPDLASMVHGMSGNMYIILCPVMLLLCEDHRSCQQYVCNVFAAWEPCFVRLCQLCDDHFVCVVLTQCRLRQEI